MKSPRARDLASIHATIKQLGMEDDTYRDMLWTVARVRSAKDLDHAGRRRVLDHLRAVGGTFKRPERSAGEWGFVETAGNNAPRLRYIIVLCTQLGIERGKQVPYVEGIAKNMDAVIRGMKDGQRTETTINLRKPLQLATASELSAIVNALERAVARKERKAAEA